MLRYVLRNAIKLMWVLALWWCGVVAVGSPKIMSVQVKETQVRVSPSFLGKGIQTLSYGNQVEVLEEKSGWCKVSLPGRGVTGWVHASAVTKEKISMKSGERDVKTGASRDELVLAGKGFNAQVEGEFKASHRDIDFRWIDAMERIKIPPSEIQFFLRAGELPVAADDVSSGGGR